MPLVKRLFLTLILVGVVFSGTSLAQTFSVELNANANDVEGKFEVRMPNWETSVNLGVGVLYGKDERLISNLNFFLKDEIFMPSLTLGLGFKGLYGYVTSDETDYDIGGVGFMALGEYDFRIDYPRIPVLISLTGSLAPGPMCFADAEQYFDTVLTAYVYIVNNAALLAGYRHVNVKLEVDQNKFTEKDNAVF